MCFLTDEDTQATVGIDSKTFPGSNKNPNPAMDTFCCGIAMSMRWIRRRNFLPFLEALSFEMSIKYVFEWGMHVGHDTGFRTRKVDAMLLQQE